MINGNSEFEWITNVEAVRKAFRPSKVYHSFQGLSLTVVVLLASCRILLYNNHNDHRRTRYEYNASMGTAGDPA